MSPGLQVAGALFDACGEALGRAAAWLEGQQHPAGFWWDRLDSGSPATPDQVLLRLWLYPPPNGEWNPPPGPEIHAFAGPVSLSESVKSYCALKLTGLSPGADRLVRLRERILYCGGLPAADSPTRFHLSRFGLCSHDLAPATPCPLPAGFTLAELFPPDPGLLARLFTSARRLWTPAPPAAADPFLPPVEATALAALALGQAVPGPSDSLRAAGRWLLAHGFSARPDAAALSLLALKHCPAADETALRAAVDRPTRWLETSQSKDGGWISPAATGLVLEALCAWGRTAKHPSVRRAIGFLLRAQQDCDGSWPGPPDAGYLHATCFALRGLRAAGYSDHEVAPLRATEWLRCAQNAAGGWGENLASAAAPGFQEAPSTVPHTAQAVLGLLAGGDTASESVRRGVEYLLGAQREDGSWPGGQPPSASGGTGSSWKNWGLAPFPQTQLAATTSNIDAGMSACPQFSSPGYCCHRPLGVLALAEYLRTRGER